MKKISLLLVSLFCLVQIFAQGIKGIIVDQNNQAVAYANIYVPALKTGTTSNIEGLFELKLPPGNNEVLFQYIGYKTHKQQFLIDTSFVETKIVFASQNIRIKEIKVLASGEDPAYYVMKRAIAMAPYYTNQVSEYDCKLYLKGSGVMYKFPRLMKKEIEKEGIKKDKPFVMESLNKIHFELPDKLEQQVIAMHVSGTDNNTSPMEMITTNLYNVSQYGIVSPVGRFALKKYNFKLAGVFEDQDRLINKIKVTPKVKGKGTFEGYINIVEDFWNIHSADLKFNMPFMKVIMHQLYGLVDENTWMPTSLDFAMDFSGFGFGIKYNYVASFSEYDVSINKNLDHSFLKEITQKIKEESQVLDSIYQTEGETIVTQIPNNKDQEQINSLMEKEDLSNREMYKLERLLDKEVKRTLPPEPLEIKERVKVKGNATKNDSLFWAGLRPIPLTEKESISFIEKDSISLVQNTQEYKDSVALAKTRFKIKHLAFGNDYRYGEDSARIVSRLYTPGFLDISEISFNTVDGFRFALPINYNMRDTMGKSLSLSTNLAYAFSRKSLDARFSAYYLFNGIKMSWIRISGGKYTTDYKNRFALSPMEGSFYSLDLEDNFQKYYQKKYIGVQFGTEIVNGLNARAGFEHANRSPLENHSTFKIINRKDMEYTPNVPDIPDLRSWQLHQSSASVATFNLTYRHKQRYRIRKNHKYGAGSKFPTLGLSYKTTLGGLTNSDANYDLLEMNIRQRLKIGFNSSLEYNIESGLFLNNKEIYAPDFKYFNSNDRLFSFSNARNKFHLLDYYEAVSGDYFLEGHLYASFEKVILKRLPILNRTLIRENLFLNYLSTELHSNYYELGYGLHGIFMMIDLDFVVGYEDWGHTRTGFKVSVNLN